MEPPRGVPASNPPRPGDFPGFRSPLVLPSRQPTGDKGQLRVRGAGAQLRRPMRLSERTLGAALKAVQKFLTVLSTDDVSTDEGCQSSLRSCLGVAIAQRSKNRLAS